MISSSDLLIHFWTNVNQLVTPDGVEIDLHNDDEVVLSVVLKNETDYPHRVQLKAAFTLIGFVTYLQLDTLEQLDEIGIETMLKLLVEGVANYNFFMEY